MRYVAILAGLAISITPTTSVVFAADQVGSVPACQISEPPADCAKGNKWVTVMDQLIPTGAYVHVAHPGCMNDSNKLLQDIIQAAATAIKPELATAAGPLSKAVAAPIGEALKNNGGDLGKIFSPYSTDGATCLPVVAIIPTSATEIQYRLLAKNEKEGNDAFKKCQPGQDTPVGDSLYENQPIKNTDKNVRTIVSTFRNWDNEKQKIARMMILYTLPQGQKPFTQF